MYMLNEYIEKNVNHPKLVLEKLKELLDEDEKIKEYDFLDYDIKIRYKRATNEKIKILAIDRQKKAAIIQSESGNTYITTTRGCTCPDYERSNSICKHMIFLFIKLDIINEYGLLKNSKTQKVEDFCNKYINDKQFSIINFYYESKVVKITDEIDFLIKENILNAKYDFNEIIDEVLVKDIYVLIPNIKEILADRNIFIAKSKIKARELKKIIKDNKKIFNEYFKDYIIISLPRKIEKFLYNNKEEIELYLKSINSISSKQICNVKQDVYKLQKSLEKNTTKENTFQPKAINNVKICRSCGCIFSLEDSICPSCKSSNFKYKIPVENKEEDLDPIALASLAIFVLFIIFGFVGVFL